jgi:hypothetical protein
MDSYQPWPPPPPRPKRSGWAIVGIACTVVLAICGLIVVGAFVALIVGLNSYGSNK